MPHSTNRDLKGWREKRTSDSSFHEHQFMPKCCCSGIRQTLSFYGRNELILVQPFMQIQARSSALIGRTSVTRRGTVELLHC
ncbi:hypothetical protein QQF64_005431 [Cirrhinus molitorella]|uniref:Uncharacterized protein n=1 Tax=Cirrhinus molitorella TaxID=172907 RepID=A0ABR3MFJ7_9TELE